MGNKLFRILFITFILLVIPLAQASAKNCNICHKTITGRWWSSDQNKNIFMCDPCARKAPENICQVCGKSILGQYRYWDGKWSRRFCKECKATYPYCCDCYFPVTDYNYPDPSVPTCLRCRKTAVTTREQLNNLFNAVKLNVGRNLGISLPMSAYQVKFCQVSSMPASPAGPGYDTVNFGYFLPHGERFENAEILLAPGMTTFLAYGMLAHEYGHACHYYLNRNCANAPGIFQEGFCEWVAYKSFNDSAAAARYAQNNKTKKSNYSQGFKMMQWLEREYGVSGTIDYVRTYTDFPRSYYSKVNNSCYMQTGHKRSLQSAFTVPLFL